LTLQVRDFDKISINNANEAGARSCKQFGRYGTEGSRSNQSDARSGNSALAFGSYR
jgi:hypothetical protein